MLPTARARTRQATRTSRFTRGIAAVLATGLAAGLVSVAAAAPAAAAVASYTGGAFTVPDGGPSNPYPITVTVPAGTGTLRALSLSLISPNHAHDGDMLFDLRSPSGVVVQIGCNDGRVSFDDANTCGSLAAFYGTDPAGTWSLYPYDTIFFGDDPNTTYGGYTLSLDTRAAPAITTAPADATTVSGTAVTFSSAATGAPTPTVQWQVDMGTGFVDLTGATSADYSVTPGLADSGNLYQAVYTNSEGAATTTAATLTVLPLAPSVTADPADTTVSSGSPVTFTSSAAGDPAPTVQWERAEPGSPLFTPVLGATSTTLTVGTTTLADDGAQYRAVYSSTAGSAVSAAATLTVTLVAPVVTQNPSDTSVASGDSVSLVAAATSEVAQTVQWEQAAPGGAFSAIVGATSATLTFDASFAQDGYGFRAVFTNPAGSTPTTTATLTVSPEGPQVTSDPADLTVEEGDPATFSAVATGDPEPLVQWQVSADGGSTYTDVPGATLVTYTIPATTRTEHLSLYRAVFTNLAGVATTTPATLQVQYAPELLVEPADVVAPSGGSATLSVEVQGTPAPTVQWQVSTDGGGTFVDVAGATSTALVVSAPTFADSGTQYRAVVSNAVGSVTSRHATLTVTPVAPTVTTDNSDRHVIAGSTVTFAARATGDPAPTVQWRVSTDGGATFADIDGATEDTYTFTAEAGADGNQYLAVFTNAGGQAATTSATLTVTTLAAAIVALPAAIVAAVPAAAAATAAIAVTGAESVPLALAAALLVAAGAAAVVLRRRSRTSE